MYDTSTMLTVSTNDKNRHFSVKREAVAEKFNAFQGGYGFHGKSKTAKNRATRREGKQLCKGCY